MPTGANPNAWQNWYHVVGSTFGTWLRGDPRGFRTFHHRQHVEGDYRKPPPPGVFAPVFEYSLKITRYPPVRLTPTQRVIICEAMIERLAQDGAEVIALAITINHFHGLARFPQLDASEQARLAPCTIQDGRDPAPRHFLGLARKHASHVLLNKELKPESPVWAKRPLCDPIRDREHQVNVARYVKDHYDQGAAVWYIKWNETLIDPNELKESPA